MKKRVLSVFAAAVLGVAGLSSCKTVQVAKFTSVENLYQVKLNSSLEEVISILGSKPYNVLSNQSEGYTIYVYKYKMVERKVNPNLINSRGGETTGTEVYNGKEQMAYFMFKNNKLESFVTSEGRKDSPALVMLNNTLYTISQSKDKYVIIPTKEEESNSGDSMNPLKMLKK
jgi:hypothetical protein